MIDYQPTFNSVLTFVARYIRDIGAGFATPLSDMVLLAPIAIYVFPRLWYASGRVNNFIDLLSGPYPKVDTATDSTLGSGTTSFEPFYVIDYQPTSNSVLTFVAGRPQSRLGDSRD